jgi:hypothetical protein
VAFETGWPCAGKTMGQQADKARAKNHDLKNRHMLITQRTTTRLNLRCQPTATHFQTFWADFSEKPAAK